jgi:molybdenum cofactor guanylyltransferase
MDVVAVNGLLLAGGESRRMGEPKWAIKYQDGPTQLDQAVGLLSAVCREVYVSCRADQKLASAISGIREIHDLPGITGPMSGVLAAMQQNPASAWLVLACDMPAMTLDTLRQLIESRDPDKEATVFLVAGSHKMPEPLCAIYEPAIQVRLRRMSARGEYSLRHALESGDVARVVPEDSRSLTNVNSPEEMQKFHGSRG